MRSIAFRLTTRSLSAVLALAACTSHLLAQAGGFTSGDLYLFAPAVSGYTDGDGRLMRIDPVTGQTTYLIQPQYTPVDYGALAFDPYRGRLVFSAGIGSTVPDVWLTDAAGNLQDLGLAGTHATSFAPTGDGRIYFRTRFVLNGDWIWYFDAAGTLRTLLDATGTSNFELFPGQPLINAALAYDPGQQALIAAFHPGPVLACPGGSLTELNVYRIPLSADGSRVSGTVTCAQAQVDIFGSSNSPVSLTRGPAGQWLLTVDTNDTSIENRLLLVDPSTLAITPFASPGNYPFSAAVDGGTWSTTLGRAVITDEGNDLLRTYGPGDSGGGTILTPSLPIAVAGAAGDLATLLEIPGGGCDGAFIAYGAGLAGKGGFVPTLSGSGCPLPGGTPTLTLANAVGGANSALFVALAPAALPFKGGTLYAAPLLLTLNLVMGGAPGVAGAGSFALPSPLPLNPLLVGVSVYFQGAFADPAAVAKVSLTQGLRMVIG